MSPAQGNAAPPPERPAEVATSGPSPPQPAADPPAPPPPQEGAPGPAATSFLIQNGAPAPAEGSHVTATGGSKAFNNGNGGMMVIVDVKSGAEDTTRGPAKRTWTDPSHAVVFKDYLDMLDTLELERAVAGFLERGVLVVECVDEHLQSAAAASVVRALPMTQLALRQGQVSDRLAIGSDIMEDDGPSSWFETSWTVRDIVHPRLADGEPCLLALELIGSRGQTLIDEIFLTKGRFDSLCEELRRRRRYLVLLPMTGATVGRAHASRVPSIHTLRLDFLPHWLELKFPQEAKQCLERIRKLQAAGEWGEGDQLLHNWLTNIERKKGGGTLLEQLEANRDAPRVITTVEQALAETNGESEPFLAAVFVAAYLPGLGQRDFSAAVEALLGGRTRTKIVAGPQETPKENARGKTVEVALIDEWRSGMRAILRNADLEVKPGPTGAKVVGFRDDRALPSVRATLDGAPFFVVEQMERLARTGLVFSRSEALSTAVVALVSSVVAAEPATYDTDWLLTLLGSALAPDSAMAEAQPSRLAGAQLTLRRLLEASTDAAVTHGSERPRTIVDQLFERVLRLEQPSAGAPIPELASRLRDAPYFDYWYWLRQTLDRGKAEARDRAQRILFRIPFQRESDWKGDTERILAWLAPEMAGSQVELAAAGAVGHWATESIRYNTGLQTESARTVATFLKHLATGDGLALTKLAAALFHPHVAAALSTPGPELVWKTVAVLLPPEARTVEVASWQDRLLGSAIPAWNATVADLLDDIDGATLSRCLGPSLALGAWCELFAESMTTLSSVAAELWSALGEELLLAVRIWLSVFIAALAELEDAILELPELGDTSGDPLLRAAYGRRKRFEEFRTCLTRRPFASEVP